ncbi:MAG TPA: ribokinase [Candidatus Limnocylindria bacterium]
MAAHVVVVGSINVDMVVHADRLPVPGETVLGGRFAIHDGGKGANQAVAAARAGARVSIIAAVGADANGVRAVAALESDHVDVSRVRRVEAEPTGVAVVAVGPRGENQIVVAPGANATLELDDADRQLIGGADALLTSLEIPMATVVDALRHARDTSVPAILNPAPAHALPAEVLTLGPILTPNEHELVVAIGNDQAASALDELATRHAGPIVVTQGAAGALLADGDEREHFDGFAPPQVVDTTGAGDAFCGVLAASLAEGMSLRNSIVRANAAAALSVAAAGARAGMPTREAIEAILGHG